MERKTIEGETLELYGLGSKASLAIIVTCCNDCPFVLKAANGSDRYCNETHEMVRKPYGNDRKIYYPGAIPETCPLKRKDAPGPVKPLRPGIGTREYND